ncbi:MAG: metallophosphoesterase, partial [Candidatus Poribacteria bacterium]|nr:metallophosphoesterase [Candidatus Poribacteria bacterium]
MPSPLRFRDDGAFRIVQFTDLHWSNGEDKDAQTRNLMADVLDADTPDLVALTGDVLSGGNCKDPSASWKQAVEVIEERGILWAAVFGNHDDE